MGIFKIFLKIPLSYDLLRQNKYRQNFYLTYNIILAIIELDII